ncbi:MAG: glutamate--tRNA ligase [Alphaproteobacteria bacterium]|nr:glutamate--tRNA ligase [Alphaproteobacteria bacterium]MCD8520061.1 glutamate--tRNA ligase [Alphaproteobacteria bacterium]MCD8525675.1 glutamate--tRNA ligase [Alphaproteobacteria bacterium]MCD8570933.1 glutamate--tRNA ligase [Alphaproteobacteria bacterium]
MTVKARFAPSPTGMLHVGNVRTAIIVWLHARKSKGHFLFRIDDTDTERSKKEYEDEIEASLKWLGLNWDEKAHQSARVDRYDDVITKLKEAGRLYACYETPEELALKRKSLLGRGLPPIYDRAGLKLTDDQKAKYEAEGRQPHWRFKLNHEPIIWQDLIRGEVKFEGEQMADPVLIREDGRPLYHLCSVIDDIDFGITHVVRGEDHVSNTASHVQMFEAIFDVEDKPRAIPQFAHLPLISDKEGGKLSKRLGSLSVHDLREVDGIEPMAVVSLMARLGTSEPIEAFSSIEPLIESFDFSKFSRGTPKFDPDELLRLNAKILHEKPFADVADRLSAMGLNGVDEEFWNSVRPNLERLSDIKDWWQTARGQITPVIEETDYIAEALDTLPPAPWNDNTWMDWVNVLKEKTGRKGKALFMPLRQALTGMEHGPEMDKMLLLIGPEKAKERLSSFKKAA